MTLLVAGERLAKRESEPFTNRAGMMFREMMVEAQIKPDNAVFIYIDDERYPEIVTTFDHVVLSGDNAVKSLHPELRIGECHSRAMLEAASTTVFPVFNHEAVARSPKELRPIVVAELSLLRRIAKDPDHWLQYVPTTCVKCRAPGYRITPRRVAYCQLHWRRPSD